MKQVRYPSIVIATFVWIGFLGAISFMEAWMKFRAPGIDIVLGLGIGRLVFNALNKMEWAMALIILISYLVDKPTSWHRQFTALIIALSILILQTFYLLPALDARAEMHIQGMDVTHSYLHLYYILLEVIKMISLLCFGFYQFKNIRDVTKQG